ncbi:MAG: DNA-3-methyladenine glycosylase family protein [Janthinobacterium lividum]
MPEFTGAARTGTVMRRELAVPGGFAAAPLRRFLHAHTIPGAERHDAVSGIHERVITTSSGAVVVTVDLGLAERADVVHVEAPEAALPEVCPAVRHWLDLDGDVDAAEAALAEDPVIGPLVSARPGLRVPRTVSGAETAMLTVLGQQVSLAAARTFAGRLVAAYGSPADDPWSCSPAEHDLRGFPAPATLAAAGPDALRAVTGVTGARSRSLHALATALAGGLDLDGAREDPEAAGAAHAALLALPGIGMWTADYIALRVLGDSDAFLSTDLVLRRAMGGITAKEALARAERWRPWRGYALLHLWTAEVFAG